MALLFATSLRESFEEMRLNPMGVKFLGPMPSTSLVMFRRVIYPLVGWLKRQKHFFPNWEVEKMVYIPLEELLRGERYACYRITFVEGENPGKKGVSRLQPRLYELIFFLYIHNLRPPPSFMLRHCELNTLRKFGNP